MRVEPITNSAVIDPGPTPRANDGLGTFALLLSAVLAWYESHTASEERERNQEANYDLTRYRPKPKGL